MADQYQVEEALQAALTAVFYPAGAPPYTSSQSPLVSPVLGSPVRIYRGWPVPRALNSDITAGILNISVFPLPTSRNSTRWLPQVVATTPGTLTLTATLVGRVVTLAGMILPGQVIGIACFGTGYAYRVLGTESSIAAIATLLAASIPGAQATGNTITLATDVQSSAAVVADSTVSTEQGRITRQFQISFWCATPQQRDASGSIAVPQLVAAPWLALPNNESGRLLYVSDNTSDKSENSNDFRRDVRFSVDYPVTTITSQTPMLFGVGFQTIEPSGAVSCFGVDLPTGSFEADTQGDIITDTAGTTLANPAF